jgi:hypothetical protein
MCATRLINQGKERASNVDSRSGESLAHKELLPLVPGQRYQRRLLGNVCAVEPVHIQLPDFVACSSLPVRTSSNSSWLQHFGPSRKTSRHNVNNRKSASTSLHRFTDLAGPNLDCLWQYDTGPQIVSRKKSIVQRYGSAPSNWRVGTTSTLRVHRAGLRSMSEIDAPSVLHDLVSPRAKRSWTIVFRNILADDSTESN